MTKNSGRNTPTIAIYVENKYLFIYLFVLRLTWSILLKQDRGSGFNMTQISLSCFCWLSWGLP